MLTGGRLSCEYGRMKRAIPHIRPYEHSSTSKYVIEGLRVHGKRIRKFFPTKEAAKAWLELKQIQIENEGAKAAIGLPEGLRVMAVECAEKLTPYGKTLLDATDFLIAHLKQTERTCTASELKESFLLAKEQDGKSDRYLKDLRFRLKRFCDDFGQRTVASFRTLEIDDWLRGLGLAPQSRNNFRTVLGVFFQYGVDRGYASSNPVMKTAKAKVVDRPVEILTPKQLRDLFKYADAELVPYLAIGAFAGLRPAEISRLDWAEVRMDRNLIEVKAAKSKTAQRRLVTIQPNLAHWLAQSVKNEGQVTPKNLRLKLKEAWQAAEMKCWPANALRHSYASYHLAKFNDAAALALQMGHADTAMIFGHYREVVRPEDADLYWEIEPAREGADVIPFVAAAG